MCDGRLFTGLCFAKLDSGVFFKHLKGSYKGYDKDEEKEVKGRQVPASSVKELSPAGKKGIQLASLGTGSSEKAASVQMVVSSTG